MGAPLTFELSLKPDAAFYETESKAGDGFREAQDCVRAVKKFLPP